MRVVLVTLEEDGRTLLEYRPPPMRETQEEAGAEFIRTDEVGTVTISGTGEHHSIETGW